MFKNMKRKVQKTGSWLLAVSLFVGALPIGGPMANASEAILLEENFDGIADGELPSGWVTDGNGSWKAENGKLVGNAPSGSNIRVLFGDPDWDHYTVEADVYFESAVNSGRWTAVMYRAENPKNNYYQFALRQNGGAEIAYRTPSNAWSVPFQKQGSPLPLGTVHKMKVSVYEENVREYLDDQLLFDENAITNRTQGLAGLQVDQAKVVYDNVKVTKLEAVSLTLPESMEAEARSGGQSIPVNLKLSDGHEMDLAKEKVQWSTSDAEVARFENGQVFPIKEGTVTITAAYKNVTASTTLTVTPSTQEVKLQEAHADQDHVILIAGQAPVQVQVTGKYNDLTVQDITAEMNWSSDQPHVAQVEKGLISPVGVGSAVINGEKDGVEVRIPVRVNQDRLESKLWIQEDFNEIANGSLPDHWKVIEGTAYVQDGQLTLVSPSSSKPARVSIPLNINKGDYIFEADLTFQSAVEDTRWASLMYRIQHENYPYYQFAMRRGTTALNGLEFAIRNANNQWEVPDTNFYHEPFAFGKTYRIKIIASGNRVQQFVNDELVINTDLASQWSQGNIGFQVNGATAHFDNVRLTLDPPQLPYLDEDAPFLAKEPQTGIVNAPITIADAKFLDDVQHLEGSGVTSVLLSVEQENGTLKVTKHTLAEMLDAIQNKAIPVLQIEDPEMVSPVAELLKQKQIDDVHIVSSIPSIVKTMKKAYGHVRGAIINVQESFTEEELNTLVQEVHAHESKVAILSPAAITPDLVHELHKHAISVWAMGTKDRVDAHRLIQAGVNGIISKQPEIVVQALVLYPENTVTQRPVVVAHRGVPSLAPENTMASYKLAYELGADVIETDVQLTKDGEIIIMHDTTVDRTTNGKGAVKELTLDQIRQLDAGSKFSAAFKGEKVPTLREFLQEFKGKDVVLLIETKAKGLEQKLVDEIEEEGMTHQVLVQSFYADSVATTHQIKPEIGLGYLYSAASPAGEKPRLIQAEKIMKYGLMLNSTLNASYDSLNPEYMDYMRQRGMATFNWTFRTQDAFSKYLENGGTGPITDYTQWMTDVPMGLGAAEPKMNIKVGEKAAVETTAKYRSDKTERVVPSLIVLKGQSSITVEGNQITGQSKGTATVMAVCKISMLGKEWNLVSAPFEVHVSNGEQSVK